MTTAIDIDAELAQYVATALWSTNADHLDPEGTGYAGHLDDHYDFGDLAPAALESMRADLVAFIDNANPIAVAYWHARLGEGQIGHDFWLTRNGHGAGFWDRFASGEGYTWGRHLTDEAKPYGETNVYVGDDGKLYVS